MINLANSSNGYRTFAPILVKGKQYRFVHRHTDNVPRTTPNTLLVSLSFNESGGVSGSRFSEIQISLLILFISIVVGLIEFIFVNPCY